MYAHQWRLAFRPLDTLPLLLFSIQADRPHFVPASAPARPPRRLVPAPKASAGAGAGADIYGALYAASPRTQRKCTFDSPIRGLCTNVFTAPDELGLFCRLHLCPAAGCGQSKRSSQKDCGQ